MLFGVIETLWCGIFDGGYVGCVLAVAVMVQYCMDSFLDSDLCAILGLLKMCNEGQRTTMKKALTFKCSHIMRIDLICLPR